MNYIVLDLEWNQGESKPSDDNKVPFEIIEIGAVKLNSEMEMIDEFSELIKPQIYKTMHHITGNLIHLKMQELKFERPFEEVIKQFIDWCGEDYLFCTWGPLDLYELQRNLIHYGFDAFSDRPLKFYDVQKLFAIEYDEEKKRRSLENAVDALKIDKDIPFHRAFSDAYYTAKVMSHIHRPATLKHFSYDVFTPPSDAEHEIYAFFGDYDKYISRTFNSKEELLSNKDVKCANCYICNKSSKKIVHPFSPNGKFYLCLTNCETHGFVKTKIRIRKTDDNKYFTVKTRKIVSEADANEIKARYEKLKLKKEETASKEG